jgi:hypothetical protein
MAQREVRTWEEVLSDAMVGLEQPPHIPGEILDFLHSVSNKPPFHRNF